MPAPVPRHTGRAVLLVLLGVLGLVLKPLYAGPHAAFVHSYRGNFCASFAAYFVLSLTLSRIRRARLLTAAVTLLNVEAFELTDGFGIMSNTYDPGDLLANLVGISVALGVDVVLGRSARGVHAG